VGLSQEQEMQEEVVVQVVFLVEVGPEVSLEDKMDYMEAAAVVVEPTLNLQAEMAEMEEL
jgi:hypothetical protein